MIDPLYSMALVTGLLGTGHCLGMCGPLVVALSISSEGRRAGFLFHLFYQGGRLATYTLIGLAVGMLGSTLAFTDAFGTVSRAVLVGSDLFLILAGLGSAGVFRGFNLMSLEFPAPMRAMTAAVGGLRRLPPNFSAFPLGVLFGFLPCGFLYAMAISAAQSADPLRGGAILLAFGIGTAPALLLVGGTAQWLGRKVRLWMVRGAGITVGLMGVLHLVRHLRMMGLL